jgi:hypothetical protein
MKLMLKFISLVIPYFVITYSPKLMIFNAAFKVVLQNKKPQTTPISTAE